MTLARSRTLSWGPGAQLRTPLLIPSFSTVRVPAVRSERMTTSVASVALQTVAGQIGDAMLVSAYDLHHAALADAEDLLAGEEETLMHQATVTIVDSGQYEARELEGARAEAWSEELHLSVLERLPESLNAAIVNFDDFRPFREQIARARFLQRRFSGRHTIMLLKPIEPGAALDVAGLAPHLVELGDFAVVAVTEKELGDTLIERFATVARLRRALDQAGVERPLHVFGGLDPLSTPLYVACGAEIVDGVGWLRYSYRDDVAMAPDMHALLELHLDDREAVRAMTNVMGNLHYLRDLRRRLMLFAEDSDWEALRPTEPRYGRPDRSGGLRSVWERVASEVGL